MSIEQYLKGTADWRTDFYASCCTVLSHMKSIELFKELGTRMTPERSGPLNAGGDSCYANGMGLG